jgi:hypothetical protein
MFENWEILAEVPERQLSQSKHAEGIVRYTDGKR